MVRERPSMQELIEGRRRNGFVGRGTERAVFRANFELPPEDERHRFLFHVHGTAGVGKTFLVREMEQLALERDALTVHVDENVTGLPETMEAMSRQFAVRGHRFKELDRLLTAYRERRHEARTAVLDAPEAERPGPSATGLAVARAGLLGLGTVPGVGALAGVVDPAQLAQGAERLYARAGARLRSQEDVRLLLAPQAVLTPVLVAELSEAAGAVPWIVLFFDTYERTGPFLDGWLHTMMTTRAYGALPATVVVVTAGQRPLDTARWGGFGDFVTDLPLGPFTETEARGLLAGKGVVSEPVVAEVLRITGGLPLLVSTLAEQRPTDPEDVGDPSATAVERFLKWEPDPLHRAVALACALPRSLDLDVFRAAVEPERADEGHADEGHADEGHADEEHGALFDWLRGLSFVDGRGDRVRYHDLVREAMLRLQRRRSPRGWTERHERLAEVFRRWREEAGSGLRDPDEVWRHEPWLRLRLEESYHRLCARPVAALGDVLHAVVEACRADRVAGRTWARMLQEAGDAAGAPALGELGGSLAEALADDGDGVGRAMELLLARPVLRGPGRALAHGVRARELRIAGEYTRALAEYARALEIDPDDARVHYGRGLTHQLLGDHPAALAAFDRADELRPATGWIIAERAETHRMAGRTEEAAADFDRAVALDPTNADALASRAVCRHALGRFEEAAADFDRALSIDGDLLWPLVRRARLRRDTDEWEKAFADLDRAARLEPDSAWIASERGDAYRLAGRFEEAVAELGRAVALAPGHPSALASRGASHHGLGQDALALADLDRALELAPEYSWALVMRARARRRLGDLPGAYEDLRRALAVDPDADWIELELGDTHRLEDRHEEAVAVFRRLLERDPGNVSAMGCLGAVHHDLREHAEALVWLDRALAADPDHAYARDQRARVFLATGRTERALADWERRIALGGATDTARLEIVELLIHCGRWDEATARLAEADPAPGPDDDLVPNRDRLRVEVLRHTGRWERARHLAERLRAADPLSGTFQLAMSEQRSRGRTAAEPWWRELARLLDAEPEERVRASGRCIVGWALAEWAAADRDLEDLLSMDPDWDELADLVDVLAELLRCPGGESARLAPRLATVTAARDAVRERHTD
ncbi:tetratricopeptide repeat protein [Streptomyces sp. NPDC058751]|uniref:tetratricopeptide repeat protein n=1 Tax=Streptomyces sp. NPDC058751 TaxID=3346623 RepID=UPI0036BE5F99